MAMDVSSESTIFALMLHSSHYCNLFCRDLCSCVLPVTEGSQELAMVKEATRAYQVQLPGSVQSLCLQLRQDTGLSNNLSVAIYNNI